MVNSQKLNVVISSDSFYCDAAYNTLVEAVNKALLDYLAHHFDAYTDWQEVMANIFCLRQTISDYLADPGKYDAEDAGTRALQILTEYKVFRVAERREPFSLKDIIETRTPDLPLFYSPTQKSVRWVGGQFKHDYVLTPQNFTLEGGLRGFYDVIMSALFKDTINLDMIHHHPGKLKELVQRGIVDPDSLKPKVKFRGDKKLNNRQKKLQDEINALLCSDEVKKVISENFDMDIRNIHTAFFEVAEAGMYIATGLFDSKGKPLADEYISNLVDMDGRFKGKKRRLMNKNILLGLNLRHPLISYLCTCKDPNRAAYSLTYVVNQLVMCQRSLVPYSAFYKLNKANLARDMRNALLSLLTKSSKEDQDSEEKA